MIEKEKVIKRIEAQIAVCNSVDSDWITLTVGTGKRILELLNEHEELKKCRHNCKIECLLDRYDELVEKNKRFEQEAEQWKTSVNVANETIDNLLRNLRETAEMIPVSCRDCAHGEKIQREEGKLMVHCNRNNWERGLDWYCGDADRKSHE